MRKKSSGATFSGEICRELTVLALVPFEYHTHLESKNQKFTKEKNYEIETLVCNSSNSNRIDLEEKSKIEVNNIRSEMN